MHQVSSSYYRSPSYPEARSIAACLCRYQNLPATGTSYAPNIRPVKLRVDRERSVGLRESEQQAKNARPGSVGAARAGRLDEPAPAADDRVPARGKPSATGAARE